MDPCSSLVPATDWNPIAAGGPASAFAAVLAGFVFIGMVYVLTEGFDRHHGATLMLFMAAFVCLAAGSYVGTLASGERVCLRAWSEAMFSSGLLAVGAAAMFAALAWLLPARYGQDRLVRWFTATCALLIMVVVAELLTTAAEGFLLDVPGYSRWRGPVGWITWITIGLVVACRAISLVTEVKGKHKATAAAGTVVLFAFVSLAFLGPIGERSARDWVTPATWTVLVSALVPLAGNGIALAAISWALPDARDWPSDTPARLPRPYRRRAALTGHQPGRGPSSAQLLLRRASHPVDVAKIVRR